MAQNLKDFYKENQTEPVLTTVGRGIREGAAAYKNAYNNAPKVVGVPAAAVANAVGDQLAALKSGLQGREVKAPEYQALTLGQMWDRTMKPGAAPAAAAPVAAAAPRAPVDQRPPLAELNALPGIDSVKDWSGARTASLAGSAQPKWVADNSDSQIAQFYRAQQGAAAGAAPTVVNVRKQDNGVLEFSGRGGGDGTGAVNYSGLPSWKSAQGGAGKGSVGGGFNLAEQNARMATVLKGIRDTDRQAKFDQLAGAKELGPLLQQQMAGENAMGVAKLNAETSRYGHDTGLKGEMARVAASKYGTDVGAQVNREGLDVERDKVRASVLNAQAKAAAGKPLSQIEQLGLQIFEGKTFKTKAARDAAMAEYIKMFQKGDPVAQMIADMYSNQQDQ